MVQLYNQYEYYKIRIYITGNYKIILVNFRLFHFILEVMTK